MKVISIERSTYEELLTSFNSFVAQMRALADRGTDKGLGDWLDNQDVCQMLNQELYKRFVTTERWPILKSTVRCTISLRMWREFCMSWMEEAKTLKCVISKRIAYERTDNAS